MSGVEIIATFLENQKMLKLDLILKNSISYFPTLTFTAATIITEKITVVPKIEQISCEYIWASVYLDHKNRA